MHEGDIAGEHARLVPPTAVLVRVLGHEPRPVQRYPDGGPVLASDPSDDVLHLDDLGVLPEAIPDLGRRFR